MEKEVLFFVEIRGRVLVDVIIWYEMINIKKNWRNL